MCHSLSAVSLCRASRRHYTEVDEARRKTASATGGESSVPLFEGILFHADDMFVDYSLMLSSPHFPLDQQLSAMHRWSYPSPTVFSRPHLMKLTSDSMTDAVLTQRGHSGTLASNPWLLKDAQSILQQHPLYKQSWMNVYGAEDTWGPYELADLYYLPTRQARTFSQLMDWLTSPQSERDATLQSMQLKAAPVGHQVEMEEEAANADYIRVVDTWLPGAQMVMANLSSANSTELWPFTRLIRRGMVFCEDLISALLQLTLDLVAAEDEKMAGQIGFNASVVISSDSSPPCSSRCPRRLPVVPISSQHGVFVWNEERNNLTLIESLLSPSDSHMFLHSIKVSQSPHWQLYRDRYQQSITASLEVSEE